MSRETKIFNCKENKIVTSKQDCISHYESFGWEVLQIGETEITMSRETQNPKYAELVKYEDKYNEINQKIIQKLSEKQNYKQASVKTALILLLIFVVPGVLYITLKTVSKNKINANNQAIDNEVFELKKQANETMLASKTLFFSRQEN